LRGMRPHPALAQDLGAHSVEQSSQHAVRQSGGHSGQQPGKQSVSQQQEQHVFELSAPGLTSVCDVQPVASSAVRVAMAEESMERRFMAMVSFGQGRNGTRNNSLSHNIQPAAWLRQCRGW
jgi:hypothetical protein